MATNESINDLAVAVLGDIRNIEAQLPSPNDTGKPSGFQDEYDALVDDARSMLLMLRNRSRLLKARLAHSS